jgi:glycosyltransferase involved in cell wall biosynthesis
MLDNSKVDGGLRTKCHSKKTEEKGPLITVVTVVYNGEKFLEETILSVINQTYDNVEYIIIDGGSTDGTLDIIKKYEHAIDYWVSEKDKGIYDAMNKGIDLATGEWINFMNADDFFNSNTVLEKVSQAIIKSSEDKVILYGQLNLINSKNQVVANISNPWHLAKKELISKLSIPHQSAFTSRNRISKVGKFNLNYMIAGDYDLTLRVLKNCEASFIDDVVIANMRIGGVSSDPKNSIRLLKEYRQAQKSIGYKYPSFSWLFACLRVYVRVSITFMFGEKLSARILDMGNKLLGRDTFWSKR